MCHNVFFICFLNRYRVIRNCFYFLRRPSGFKKKLHQSRFAHSRFPALGAVYVYELRVPIGPLCCLRFFTTGQGSHFGFVYKTQVKTTLLTTYLSEERLFPWQI